MDNHLVEDEEHDPTVHHEERDINVRGVLILTAIFVVFMGVLFFGTWFLFKGFAHAERKKDIALISEVKGATHAEPPAPRLQPFPEVADELNESTRRANEGIGADMAPVPTREPVRATPLADMREMHHEVDTKTTTYGWVDRPRGVVRIPIAEAKKRLLAKGLPVASATPATATPPPVTTTTPATSIAPIEPATPPGSMPVPRPTRPAAGGATAQ